MQTGYSIGIQDTGYYIHIGYSILIKNTGYYIYIQDTV